MKRWLTMLMVLSVVTARAQTVALAWDASPSPGVVGYRIYFGTNAGQYVLTADVGAALAATVRLPHPGRWFFTATAVDGSGLESNFSNVVEWVAKPTPPVLHGETWVRLTPVLERSTNLVAWTEFAGEATWMQATNVMEFFRLQRLGIERVQRVSEP